MGVMGVAEKVVCRPGGHFLGVHRVVRPKGVLPQAARRLDTSLPLYEGETLLHVERLHVDSASFRQLREQYGDDPKRIGEAILAIVEERGKLENPVTGSGGMLIGRIEAAAESAPDFGMIGQKVATLVSLTLTPLHLDEIVEVDLATGQVEAQGHAILFASGVAAALPTDLPEAAALSILDVCGAPAWTRKLVQATDQVLILGAGKSGILSAFAAREAIPQGSLWIADASEVALEKASATGVAGNVVLADAQEPIRFLAALQDAGAPAFDLTLNTSNAPETETASILASRDGGRILFFNMATAFQRAVLTAEGVGRETMLIMGNGYAKGHWQYALDLVRGSKALQKFFER